MVLIGLSAKAIERLASRKNVRRLAVENFLMSMGGLTVREALMNLSRDAEMYRWNTATQNAIRAGIWRAQTLS